MLIQEQNAALIFRL